MSATMASEPQQHRVTVEEYYRMAEAGLLAPSARVELVEGEIIDTPPVGSAHGAVVARLARALSRSVGDRAILRVRDALTLSELSEPQPDVVLVRPREDFYSRRKPGPQDTLLIIEVSDTTARYDREIKVPLYARHRIVEVWLVDLEERRLHVFRSPAGSDYLDTRVIAEPGLAPIALLPGVQVDLSHLMDI